MNFLRSTIFIKQTILFAFLFAILFFSFSQEVDTVKEVIHFSGAVTATNNGISLIPSFSLGKPAAIFDFAVAKKRLSFEPQLRFSIEDAKPWSFVFWVRYKLVQDEKFKMSVGAHPSFVFQSVPVLTNGVLKDALITNRY